MLSFVLIMCLSPLSRSIFLLSISTRQRKRGRAAESKRSRDAKKKKNTITQITLTNPNDDNHPIYTFRLDVTQLAYKITGVPIAGVVELQQDAVFLDDVAFAGPINTKG